MNIEKKYFSNLEYQVMKMLLYGDDNFLEILRNQFKLASLLEREYTGVGFFTDISLPENVQKLKPEISFQLSDVGAEVDGLKYGLGFVLFITNGAIELFEVFTYDEKYPESVGKFTLHYLKDTGKGLISVSERDFESLRKNW